MNREPFFISAQLDPLRRINDICTRKQTYRCKNFSIALLESGAVIVTAKSNEEIVACTEIVATGILFKEFVYCTCSARVLPQNEKINSSVFCRYSGTCSRVDVETVRNGIVHVYVFPQSLSGLSRVTKEDAQMYTITSKVEFRSPGEVTFVACLVPEK
jgi:hypothetical protein